MDLNDKTLMDICLDLRMAHNGSADPIPAKETAEALAYLRERLAAWRPSPLPSGARFDECVRQLVLATIDEVEASMARTRAVLASNLEGEIA